MIEEKIRSVITLDDLNGDNKEKEGLIVQTTVEKTGSSYYQELDDNMKKARAEYISTEQDLKSISKKYNIAEKKLQKLCSAGKWNILKRNPEMEEFLLDVVNEVYDAIDVFEFGKYLTLSCMKSSEYHNPKDITLLINTFKLCNDEINKLRVANINNAPNKEVSGGD